MSAEVNRPEPSVVTALRGIYTDTVVDHVLDPRGFGSMPNADGHGQVVTPEGDSVRVWLRFKDDRVVDACFWTDACAATVASGSMVTELVMGRTPAEALGVSQQDVLDALGGLPEGNVHCALLAVNALRAAVREYLVMRGSPGNGTTERTEAGTCGAGREQHAAWHSLSLSLASRNQARPPSWRS